ncbi:hypothetical protein ACXIUT_07660 [Achromobacter denitrificans]
MGKLDRNSPFLRGEKPAEWKDKLRHPDAGLLTPAGRGAAPSAEDELREYMKEVSRRPGYGHVGHLLQQAQRKR